MRTDEILFRPVTQHRWGVYGGEVSAISITLSERNLRSLLAKLDGHPKESACTIVSDPGADGPTLIVHAEPDDVHYANRVPAGPMHSDTEGAIDTTLFQRDLEAQLADPEFRAEFERVSAEIARVQRPAQGAIVTPLPDTVLPPEIIVGEVINDYPTGDDRFVLVRWFSTTRGVFIEEEAVIDLVAHQVTEAQTCR